MLAAVQSVGAQMQQRSQSTSDQHLTSIILSLFPFNQIFKLIQLAPRKHDVNIHTRRNQNERANNDDNHENDNANDDASTEMALQTSNRNFKINHNNQTAVTRNPLNNALDLINNLAQRNRRRLGALGQQRQTSTSHLSSIKYSTTRLPRVTNADLLSLHHIHAASLNGLAGQQQQPPAALNEIASAGAQAAPGASPQTVDQQQQQQQNARKPAQPSTSNFVQAPPPLSTNTLDFSVESHQNQRVPLRSQAGGVRGPQMPPSPSTQRVPQSNRFSFGAGHSTPSSQFSDNAVSSPTTTSGQQQHGPFDSSSNSLATTNSISVHNSQQQLSSTPNNIAGGLFSSPATSTTPAISSQHNTQQQMFAMHGAGSGSGATLSPGLGTSTPLSSAGNVLQGAHSHHSHQQHNGANVLASFNAPSRAGSGLHNSIGHAKSSLDGIIAIAIFGGFIFLGIIITILVVIVRR